METAVVIVTKETRKKLIEDHIYIVKSLARKYSRQFPENKEEVFCDLYSYGLLGLVEAANKYDPSKNIKFSTYATLKVRGAILDGIRKESPKSRKTQEKIKLVKTAYEKCSNRLGRKPTDKEIADELNISVEEYRRWMAYIIGCEVISLEELVELDRLSTTTSEDNNPAVIYEWVEVKKILRDAINNLVEQQRLVIRLYYYKEIPFKKIASILKVSESRISQIHRKALSNLREILLA